MKLNKFGQMALLLIVALLVAACGGGGSDTSGGGGDAGGSGDAGSSVNLSQNISSTDFSGGTVTVSYPEGWAARESSGNVTIGNSEAALDAGASGAIPADVVNINVSATPGMAAAAAATSPVEMMTMFSQASGGMFTLEGEVEELQVGGKAAAYQEGMVSAEGQTAAIALLIIDLGDGIYGQVLGGAAEGQIGQYESQIKAIGGSITYAAAEGE
jgi:hypothetical protein